MPSNIAGNVVPAFFLSSIVHQENLLFCAKQLEQVEYDTAKELFGHYCYRYQKYNPRSANIWLRKHVASIRAHEGRFPLPLSYINSELKQAMVAREWANRVASIINQLTHGMTRKVAAQTLLHEAMAPARAWGFSPMLPVIDGEATDTQLDMAASALARLQDADWWERQIRKAYRRLKEHVAIIVGKVRKGVSPYVSHKAAQEHKERRRAGAAWMHTMYAINEELGLEIPLADAVKASVANPEIRRMELMVRMRGFEDLAEEQGWAGEFYTWTAPSKYHAWTVMDNRKKAQTGEKLEKRVKTIQNDKYQGFTPSETQAYLCRQWNKARAKLDRLGIRRFGFRVVEPHHDGTPHWHLLIFVHPSQRRLLRSVLRHYAIEHDRQELGRKGYRARFDWKEIKDELGSATGYIAKYISKNIDGFNVGVDEETGTDANDTAPNVAAWASLWRIRQFQQIGGPSVQVWRELRRLREATRNPIIEPARRAADTGKWAQFVEAMGGIDSPRRDHLIKLAHIIKPAASKYGEDVAKLLGLRTIDITTSVNGIPTGVMVGVSEAQTRHQGWTLSRTGLGERSELPSSGGSRAPWSSDNNCTEDQKGAEKDPLDHEMAMLGLDARDKERLLNGAVIEIDGLFISIRNGCLNTGRHRPGLRPTEDPLAIWEENEFAELGQERERDRAARYRRDALHLLHRGADIEHWLAAIPPQYQALALDQITTLVEQMEYEASWQDDDLNSWIDELEESA
ncbi:replication protein [Zobellella denitrificans]|uniref:Replication protein n=1 Tax=Zobellella denitrificans TaxID=347534 RepID=A0A291HUD4_9GAMM|nr:replication protein [Zobellella denitrificans]